MGSSRSAAGLASSSLRMLWHSHLGPIAAQTPTGAGFSCREIEINTKPSSRTEPFLTEGQGAHGAPPRKMLDLQGWAAQTQCTRATLGMEVISGGFFSFSSGGRKMPQTPLLYGSDGHQGPCSQAQRYFRSEPIFLECNGPSSVLVAEGFSRVHPQSDAVALRSAAACASHST